MKAVIYARVSTDEQKEKGYSLASQVKECQAYCKRLGYQVIATFSESYTGTIPIEDRPQGKKLVSLLRTGKAKAVIAYRVDRLSRNNIALLVSVSQWLKQGIEIHALDIGKIEDENSILLLIKGWQGTQERKTILERMNQGKNSKAQAGKVIGSGTLPFGARIENGQYVPDGNIATVKKIFHWFHVGDGKAPPLSLRGLCIKLNSLGIASPNGRKNSSGHWTPTTLRLILKNPLYMGKTYWGKTRIINEVRVKQKEWIEIPCPRMAVIDEATFQAVQKRLKNNRLLSTRNAKHEYLLSGFSICAKCEHAVAGSVINSTWQGKKYPYPAYRCCRHWLGPKDKPCPNRNRHIVAHKADKLVWDWIVKLLTDEKELDESLEAMAQRRECETQPLQERLVEIDSMLAKTLASIERLVKRLGDEEDEAIADTFKKELDSVKHHREGLNTEREDVLSRLEKIQVTPLLADRIKHQAAEIRRKLSNPSFARKRDLFRDINLQVIFHYSDEPKKRKLVASCELHPDGIVLNPSSGSEHKDIVIRFEIELSLSDASDSKI